MNHVVKVSRGYAIGMGRVKIPKTTEFYYEIPILSFLDIQESENSFISTCIHLHIDGYGKTVDEAEEDMVESIYYFLRQNFEKLARADAWDNLRDLFKSDEWSNELWDAYHEIQIQLAIQGRVTDNTASLFKRLEQLSRAVEKLESRVKNMEQEEARIALATGIRKLAKDLIVDKTSLEAA